MTLVRNRPTPEGRKIGELFGKLIDKAAADLKVKFPDMEERCKSCAYRPGTFPNGCPDSILDAIKCALEMREFYCHEVFDADGKPTTICAGWMIAVSNGEASEWAKRVKPLVAPWPFSHDVHDGDMKADGN